MYTLNDFFCGCGGLGLGFQNAGFKIVGAWDFDKYAVATYRENVGDHVVQADIQKMHIEDVPKADVWAFGFPCQDLSVAGKQAGIKLECADCGTVWEVSAETYSEENLCPGCGGTNHMAATRSGMFFEIMRLLAEAREREPEKVPKVLVAENVKALRKLLPVLEAEYGKAGYKCHAQLFNSKYWGVPQNRERYIVVGTLDSLPDTYTYPEEQHDYHAGVGSVLNRLVIDNDTDFVKGRKPVPSMIWINGLPYTVQQGIFKELQDEDLGGRVTYDTLYIQIMEDLKPDIKSYVVVHEITHAVLFEANAGNYDSKETFVEALAWQLLYFLQDNDLSILKPEGE